MLTEKEKMLEGMLYNAADPELVQDRKKARMLLKKWNAINEEDAELRKQVLKELISIQGKGLWIEPPFYCDYGSNIHIGNQVFFNFNCIVLDIMPVTIGDRVQFGPSVQLLTPMHPLNWKERAAGPEYAKPVTIGNDVWIGGGVIVCPGVTIGSRCVIGAGSVVTRNIPDDVFAAGNPCKRIRSLL